MFTLIIAAVNLLLSSFNKWTWWIGRSCVSVLGGVRDNDDFDDFDDVVEDLDLTLTLNWN